MSYKGIFSRLFSPTVRQEVKEPRSSKLPKLGPKPRGKCLGYEFTLEGEKSIRIYSKNRKQITSLYERLSKQIGTRKVLYLEDEPKCLCSERVIALRFVKSLSPLCKHVIRYYKRTLDEQNFDGEVGDRWGRTIDAIEIKVRKKRKNGRRK